MSADLSNDKVRRDPPPLRIHSTMRIDEATGTAREARGVDRLFAVGHSVLGNSPGGPNPTNAGQTLAMWTAERLFERCFAGRRPGVAPASSGA
jgi:hypothetical protein